MSRNPNLLTAKTHRGLTLGRAYKTRNGSILRRITSRSLWHAPMMVVKATDPEDADAVGRDICLLSLEGPGVARDPLKWVGGAFGTGMDVVAEYEPRKTAKKTTAKPARKTAKKTTAKPARKAKKG